MPQPGEVVLIPSPYTDLATTKRRPILVLRATDGFGDFLAAAVTSHPGHADALTLTQTDFQDGRLPKPSYVRTTKLYTLNERLVVRRFGALTSDAFARVHAAICVAVGCQR
jgi:mRNA interferase MazF